MKTYSLVHLSDASLLRDLAKRIAQERLTTAELLAYIAEVDARGLYRAAGYPSMFAYCLGVLRLSEDATYKRIQAARVARRFPELFEAIATGRLHLTAVGLLAPHLTQENLHRLIDLATHRGRVEIEGLLAPRSEPFEVRTKIRPLPAKPKVSDLTTPVIPQLALEQVEGESPSARDVEPPPPHIEGGGSESVAPSAERFLVQLTISKSTHDKLRHAQALLSHALPAGDVAQVLDRALDVLISHLEKSKIGAAARDAKRNLAESSPHKVAIHEMTAGPCEPRERHALARKRHVPASVRRAVWERDDGQCTFVAGNGHRCEARRFLEFDHVQPVARGGTASVEGIRLRCRPHNQYEAERVFGSQFMKRKREEAQRARG